MINHSSFGWDETTSPSVKSCIAAPHKHTRFYWILVNLDMKPGHYHLQERNSISSIANTKRVIIDNASLRTLENSHEYYKTRIVILERRKAFKVNRVPKSL